MFRMPSGRVTATPRFSPAISFAIDPVAQVAVRRDAPLVARVPTSGITAIRFPTAKRLCSPATGIAA
ncbi:hypothetical protein DWG18_09395 [Lysobacter sp. TY2-98]|nr:hypothetical protein DWG18_09395 [Lysobacter sp. TY2-98]